MTCQVSSGALGVQSSVALQVGSPKKKRSTEAWQPPAMPPAVSIQTCTVLSISPSHGQALVVELTWSISPTITVEALRSLNSRCGQRGNKGNDMDMNAWSSHPCAPTHVLPPMCSYLCASNSSYDPHVSAIG